VSLNYNGESLKYFYYYRVSFNTRRMSVITMTTRRRRSMIFLTRPDPTHRHTRTLTFIKLRKKNSSKSHETVERSSFNSAAFIQCSRLHCNWGGSVAEWLACRTQHSGAEGPGFKSQSRRCRVTVLGKLLTPIVPLHQAAKW